MKTTTRSRSSPNRSNRKNPRETTTGQRRSANDKGDSIIWWPFFVTLLVQVALKIWSCTITVIRANTCNCYFLNVQVLCTRFSYTLNSVYSLIFFFVQDRINCPFFIKTGACRYGDHCSRIHPIPNSSTTLIIRGMYSHVVLTQQLLDEHDEDVGLEASGEEERERDTIRRRTAEESGW